MTFVPAERKITDMTIPYGIPDAAPEGKLLAVDDLGAYYSNEQLAVIGGGDIALGAQKVLLAMTVRDFTEGAQPPLV